MLGQLIERGEFLYTSHERGLSLEEKSQFRKLVGEGSYKRNEGEEKTMAERRMVGWLPSRGLVAPVDPPSGCTAPGSCVGTL